MDIMGIHPFYLQEGNNMDKTYQDIHINNNKTHGTRVIREVRINHITFLTDCVVIEYYQDDIKILMEVPKPNYAITID